MSILKEICRYINDINTDRILSCKLDYYNEDIKLKKIYNIHIYNVKLTSNINIGISITETITLIVLIILSLRG